MFRSAPWISIFIYWLEPSSHIPKFPSLRMSTCQVTMMILDHRGPSNARNTHTHNQTLQNQLAAGEDFVHRAKWVCSIRILPIPTLSIWNQLIIPFVRPTARWAACCMPVPRVSPSGHTHFPCAVIARLLCVIAEGSATLCPLGTFCCCSMWLYVTFWIHFVESKSHTFTAHSWNSILSSNLVIFTLWIWIVPDNDVCNTAPLILPYSSPVAYVQCQHFHGTFTFINHAWLTFLWRLAGHASKAWILMAGCGRMWQDEVAQPFHTTNQLPRSNSHLRLVP